MDKYQKYREKYLINKKVHYQHGSQVNVINSNKFVSFSTRFLSQKETNKQKQCCLDL